MEFGKCHRRYLFMTTEIENNEEDFSLKRNKEMNCTNFSFKKNHYKNPFKLKAMNNPYTFKIVVFYRNIFFSIA